MVEIDLTKAMGLRLGVVPQGSTPALDTVEIDLTKAMGLRRFPRR